MLGQLEAGLRRIYRKLKSRPFAGPLEIAPAALAQAAAETPDTVPAYGADLDLLVRAAALNPRPRGAGAEYDRIKPHFDAPFYFAHNPDIAALKIDPVWHYIKAGAEEGRDPAAQFSTRAYARRYPDVADWKGTPFDHWLQVGRAENRSATPTDVRGMDKVLGLTQGEILDHHAARQADLRDRLWHGELGRMVHKAAEHDPAVLRVWTASMRLRVLPFSSTRITNRISSLHGYQAALDWRRAKVVFVNDGPPAADDMLPALIAAAVAEVGAAEVVVLDSDKLTTPEAAAAWNLPKGVRLMHLEGQYQRQQDDNVRLLTDLLRSLRPALVVADRCPMFTRALRAYGLALRSCFRIAMTPPRLQTSPLGFEVPIIETMLYRTLGVTDHLICADAAARDAVIAGHYLDADAAAKLVTAQEACATGGMAALIAPRKEAADA